MSRQYRPEDMTFVQKLGIVVFVLLCGFPAMQMNGFIDIGEPLSLPFALGLAGVGGALGGAMFCSRPIVAGIVGGIFAGALGLLAIYFYTASRDSVWSIEIVIVQGLASLPGFGLGWIVKSVLGSIDSNHDSPQPPAP